LLWFDWIPSEACQRPRDWEQELWRRWGIDPATGAPLGKHSIEASNREVRESLRLEAQSQNLWELLSWMRRSLSLFDSERFRSRVSSLKPEAAASALHRVERVRQMLSGARQQLVLTGKVSDDTFKEISEAVDAVLSAAALEIADPAVHALGLRELRVELPNRLGRVLYGVDPGAKRVLLILGEALDRTYYGDAVRLAEKQWNEYLASEYLTQAATTGDAQA
jgi:hypothetical protein